MDVIMDFNALNNFSGKMLASTPYTLYGTMFHKALIYVLSHTKEGSVGLIVNNPISSLPLSSLTKSANAIKNDFNIPIYLGGPVDLEKSFFLHSGDYDKDVLFKFQTGLAASANASIIEDIANNKGPAHSLFMLGYTYWYGGQLEFELENNLWIVLNFNYDQIFSEQNEQKWVNSLKTIDIKNFAFASQSGFS
jgi:putative transcriptional regulator